MEYTIAGLSKWFYLGLIAIIFGMALIRLAKKQVKSKKMENGYFLLIIGLVGVISEWTDFATVLFIFVLISGIILLLVKASLIKITNDETPHYVHYAKEFFPVVLVVWVLRAFLFEAYQIPSSSMRPDLTVGDFVLVNKYAYGIREPFMNSVLININQVKRGDVIVFKDQQVKNRDLIKRVVAIGGDTIQYKNKKLTINGTALSYSDNGSYTYSDSFPNVGKIDFVNQAYIEDLFGVKHPVITWDKAPSLDISSVVNFKGKENCNYISNDEFICHVPQGEYFAMGDNRDNSLDSRYWGFVPNNALLGKAIYVLINFKEKNRFMVKI
jgi:signal peptidase I